MGKQCEPHRWRRRCGAHLPTLWGEGSEKEQWPLPALLPGRKLPPALALMPYTSFPSCVPLVQDATPVLELRGSESEEMPGTPLALHFSQP